MHNILHVFKHEITRTLGKPVFWLTTFVLPIVILVFSLGAQFISMRALTEEPEIMGQSSQPAESILAIGYVDYANIIHDIPPGIPSEFIRAYPNETAAQQAIDAGKLSHYYVIEKNYLESGNLLIIDMDFSPLGDISTMDLFRNIITYNLTGSPALSRLVTDPIHNLEAYALDDDVAGDITKKDDGTQSIISFGVLFILFMILTMSSGYMLRSVAQEKENRTVEVLLVSMKARDLIIGKIAGLGTVAMLQMIIWFGGSTLILQQSNPLLKTLGVALTQDLMLPRGFMIWAVLYLLLGYILYASLLGAIGALAPNSRETGQFTFIALMPLMIPMWVNTVFIQAPNGKLATFLSLFPLTAPTSMLPRLANGGVPLWQPVVSLIGLGVTTYFFIHLAARFFRADTLLSSASLDWKRLLHELSPKRS
ncbi:MAG: ABC transporter permease [Anaerolineae bacterium]|nr:ABC transporter permease [Anaerolineae bacterium]